MIAVFARFQHLRNTDWNGHGYSVIAVRCRSQRQINEVSRLLNSKGLPEPYGHQSKWYAGSGWDYIFTIPGNKVSRVLTADDGRVWFDSDNDGYHRQARPEARAEVAMSIGDARYIGIYDAAELLASVE